ncbi:hypothetical protein PLESTF_000409200 [Pleodorina starrii]|nr:hypothetical protein PLESTM_001450700 [Pleodorina starrii]GLC66300.1 hypothetical protein PLESTF_000409200 [Pleodorina starrii]
MTTGRDRQVLGVGERRVMAVAVLVEVGWCVCMGRRGGVGWLEPRAIPPAPACYPLGSCIPSAAAAAAAGGGGSWSWQQQQQVTSSGGLSCGEVGGWTALVTSLSSPPLPGAEGRRGEGRHSAAPMAATRSTPSREPNPACLPSRPSH